MIIVIDKKNRNQARCRPQSSQTQTDDAKNRHTRANKQPRTISTPEPLKTNIQFSAEVMMTINTTPIHKDSASFCRWLCVSLHTHIYMYLLAVVARVLTLHYYTCHSVPCMRKKVIGRSAICA